MGRKDMLIEAKRSLSILGVGRSQPPMADHRVAVVIASRDRAISLLNTLGQLLAMPERPKLIVVDNASSDGSAETVRRRYPEVEVIRLSSNMGCGARTVGLQQAETPYVAFSDDDSWWSPGALARAAELLDAFPRLALVAASVRVGREAGLDPTCAEMAASPLRSDFELPGKPILGFIGCGAVVRRSAFLEVGGFDARFGIGGEEELLAIDLAAAGWGLAYVEDVVAHHHPSPQRDGARRRRIVMRNALWSTWLRRPLPDAARRTIRLLRPALRDPSARSGFRDALGGLAWVRRERRVVSRPLARALQTLDRSRP